MIDATTQDRFWRKVAVSDDRDACWNWIGASNGKYGSFHFLGKGSSAHRAAYQILVGPIPEGLVIDHLCRNKLCVNPRHLEPVTMRENTARGIARFLPAQRAAAMSHCKHGHPRSGDNVYIYPDGRKGCRVCARIGDARYKQKLRIARAALQEPSDAA